jgi:hypothetical protein
VKPGQVLQLQVVSTWQPGQPMHLKVESPMGTPQGTTGNGQGQFTAVELSATPTPGSESGTVDRAVSKAPPAVPSFAEPKAPPAAQFPSSPPDPAGGLSLPERQRLIGIIDKLIVEPSTAAEQAAAKVLPAAIGTTSKAPPMQTSGPPQTLPPSMQEFTATTAAVSSHASSVAVPVQAIANGPAGLLNAKPAGLAVEVKQMLTELKSFLQPISMENPRSQLAQALQQAIEDGGLFYERKIGDLLRLGGQLPAAAELQGKSKAAAETAAPKLFDEGLRKDTLAYSLKEEAISESLRRDLKPNLLLLKRFIESQESGFDAPAMQRISPKEIGALKRGVTQILAYIDQQQERAVQRSAENEAYQVVMHWLPAEEQSRPVGLKIHYPKEGEGRRSSGQEHRVALLLQMDRLGDVRVDLAMQPKHLLLDFYLHNALAKQTVDDHLEEIRAQLVENFDQVTIATHVSSQKIEAFVREEGWGIDAGRINIQA